MRSFAVGTSKFVVVMAFIAGSATGRTATLTYSQEPIVPLTVEELSAGSLRSLWAVALMNAESGGAIANVGFVVGEDAVAVTGGSARERRALLAAIRRVTQKPIKYVINTHAHPDHVCNAAFAPRRFLLATADWRRPSVGHSILELFAAA